jgi:hypothetical protein
MTKFQLKRDRIRAATHKICPKIQKKSWKDPKMKQGTVYVDGKMSRSSRLTTCMMHVKLLIWLKVHAHVGDGRSIVSIVHMLVLSFTCTNKCLSNIKMVIT